MAEYWNAYTQDGQMTTTILKRGEEIPKGLFHLVVECIIIHEDSSVLFTKRDKSKPSYPNYYEASAGGSALFDETAKDAIIREVCEETNIQLKEDELFHHHHFVDEKDQCIFELYWAKVAVDKNAITLQEGETSDFIWVPLPALPHFLEEQLVIPRQKQYLEKLFLDH